MFVEILEDSLDILEGFVGLLRILEDSLRLVGFFQDSLMFGGFLRILWIFLKVLSNIGKNF